MDAKELLISLRDYILHDLCGEKGTIPARVRLEFGVVARRNMNKEEELYYGNLLKELMLTDEQPGYIMEFTTSENNIVFLKDNRPLCLPGLVNMMRLWVCDCLGSDCSHQVALDDAQCEKVRNEFLARYGCGPEECGVSPRGGAVVVEMLDSGGADWLAVQLGIVCISDLGAAFDMTVALKGACYVTGRLINKSSLIVSDMYPNDIDLLNYFQKIDLGDPDLDREDQEVLDDLRRNLYPEQYNAAAS